MFFDREVVIHNIFNGLYIFIIIFEPVLIVIAVSYRFPYNT